MADDELAGIGVLVTRPKHQATALVEAIEAKGGSTFCFPAIEVVPRDAASISTDASTLQNPDIAIFVSPNAVQSGLSWAGSAAIAVIGPATAKAVEAAGREVNIRPASGYDSEHLLAQFDAQRVQGKVIRIIRGNGGREHLADALTDRGATVEYLPVYTRRAPEYSASELDHLEKIWRSGAVNVVTVMSVETLTNLIAILPDWCRTQFVQTPLVTPAARVIKEALDLLPGIPATLARGPQAFDMVRAIVDRTAAKPGHPR
jgi:uroporphyrinogen-III synthase